MFNITGYLIRTPSGQHHTKTNAEKVSFDTKVECGHCVSAWGTLAVILSATLKTDMGGINLSLTLLGSHSRLTRVINKNETQLPL